MNSFQVIRPRSTKPVEDETACSPVQTGEPSASAGRGRKRRAPAHVSQNACTNCKKARAKCDGSDGQACSRCNSRGLSDSCTYELHVKTAKEELVRRIRQLENTLDTVQIELKEKDLWIEAITQAFRPGTPGQAILQHLQERDHHRDLIRLLSSPPSFSLQKSRALSRDADTDEAMSTDDDSANASRWTSVTQDENKIHHLMALYFTWVHPVHMLFSERHFMDSFKNNGGIYCSSALVNAICAMGTRYFVNLEGDDFVVRRMGERFMQQARTELKAEKIMTPLSTVAYAIIFLVELSSGRARDAFSHLRLAVDSLRDLDRAGWSDEAYQITSFGIHSLNVNWAALTYQKPPDPISTNVIVFENVELDRPGQSWHNYKVEMDAGGPDVPTHAIGVAKEFAKLSLIHLDVICEWCGALGKLTTKRLLDLYSRYLEWRRDLPQNIRVDILDVNNEEPLPCTLLLHINYLVGVGQLFNPLLENQRLTSKARYEILKIVLQTAWEGLQLYKRFTNRFSNRYQTPLQAFFLVHLADIIIRRDRQKAIEVVHFCLQQLGAALPGFAVIGPLQAMFCETVLACGLQLPKDIDTLMGGHSWESYSREDKLGCSERLTYTQPVDRLAEAIDASLPENFEADWETFHAKLEKNWAVLAKQEEHIHVQESVPSARKPSDIRSMDISSIINP